MAAEVEGLRESVEETLEEKVEETVKKVEECRIVEGEEEIIQVYCNLKGYRGGECVPGRRRVCGCGSREDENEED